MIFVSDSPLIRHKLGIIRNQKTTGEAFRTAVGDIACGLLYDFSEHLPVEQKTVESWAGPVEVEAIAENKLTFVPILRAGLGFYHGVSSILPNVPVSFLALKRNEESLEAEQYYSKLVKDIDQRSAIILDPMLATGGSMVAAIETLKKAGCKKIYAITLICAPEGLRKVEAAHPDVEIFTASIDERLNEHGYILPGLGDAGDRLFGTN